MSTDRDVTRIVRSWLDEGVTQLPDRVLDLVLDQVPATPQRRAGWPARRFPIMNNNMVRFGIAAAVIVLVAILGIRFLPWGNVGGDAEPTPTPVPTATATPVGPAPIAAGSFTSHGGQIDLEATGEGSDVRGSMIYADEGGADLGGFTVDLACTRTSDAGLILIGGPIVESTKGYAQDAPVGTNIAIVLQRGTPVKAFIHVEHPDPHEADCLTFLESVPDLGDSGFDSSILEPIVGAVELNP